MTKEEMIELARQAGFERLGHTAEDWVCHFEDIEEFTKLVADLTKNSQPEQEPLAWISTGTARMIHWTADKPAYGDDWVPLYTTPPQRTWVELTEDDRVLIKHDANFNQFMTAGEYADRVQQLTEARLKDLNT